MRLRGRSELLHCSPPGVKPRKDEKTGSRSNARTCSAKACAHAMLARQGGRREEPIGKCTHPARTDLRARRDSSAHSMHAPTRGLLSRSRWTRGRLRCGRAARRATYSVRLQLDGSPVALGNSLSARRSVVSGKRWRRTRSPSAGASSAVLAGCGFGGASFLYCTASYSEMEGMAAYAGVHRKQLSTLSDTIGASHLPSSGRPALHRTASSHSKPVGVAVESCRGRVGPRLRSEAATSCRSCMSLADAA